jgi:hypothetical protein
MNTNGSTKLSDRVWNWLACKALPDAAFAELLREDFDEGTFGATRVEWPVQPQAVGQRVLSSSLTPAALPSV